MNVEIADIAWSQVYDIAYYYVVHTTNDEASYVKAIAFWDCRRNPKILISHVEHLA